MATSLKWRMTPSLIRRAVPISGLNSYCPNASDCSGRWTIWRPPFKDAQGEWTNGLLSQDGGLWITPASHGTGPSQNIFQELAATQETLASRTSPELRRIIRILKS